MSFQRYRKYQALRKRRQELEKILETNVLKCNDPFHHLPRTLMRGIESATCLCKQLMKGKKRKPLQSRGRPLASGRKHKKSKLPTWPVFHRSSNGLTQAGPRMQAWNPGTGAFDFHICKYHSFLTHPSSS